MAILDFIKNRGQAVPAPANEQSGPKLETAQQMYARQDAEDKATRPKIDQLQDSTKAKALELGKQVNQVGEKIGPTAPPTTPTPNDDPKPPNVARHDMTGAEKSQPALSPTDGQTGRTSLEKASSPTKETESPSPTPTPSPRGPDRGGWER